MKVVLGMLASELFPTMCVIDFALARVDCGPGFSVEGKGLGRCFVNWGALTPKMLPGG